MNYLYATFPSYSWYRPLFPLFAISNFLGRLKSLGLFNFSLYGRYSILFFTHTWVLSYFHRKLLEMRCFVSFCFGGKAQISSTHCHNSAVSVFLTIYWYICSTGQSKWSKVNCHITLLWVVLSLALVILWMNPEFPHACRHACFPLHSSIIIASGYCSSQSFNSLATPHL